MLYSSLGESETSSPNKKKKIKEEEEEGEEEWEGQMQWFTPVIPALLEAGEFG